jgi:hypothetical protein
MEQPHRRSRDLDALEQGDSTAMDRLFPLVYEELRAIAHRQRRRCTVTIAQYDGSRPRAYLKLINQSQ